MAAWGLTPILCSEQSPSFCLHSFSAIGPCSPSIRGLLASAMFPSSPGHPQEASRYPASWKRQPRPLSQFPLGGATLLIQVYQFGISWSLWIPCVTMVLIYTGCLGLFFILINSVMIIIKRKHSVPLTVSYMSGISHFTSFWGAQHHSCLHSK